MSIFATRDFNRFFTAYIECALWSSDLEGELSPEILEVMEADAKSFYSRTYFYVPYDKEATPHNGDAFGQLGHDFWLDQNGHGAGAQDGHWPIYGNLFKGVAKMYPERDLWDDGDGVIY